MTDNAWIIVAIVLYFGVMLSIGFYSWRRTKKYDDYVLGDRGLHPFVAGLSAGASDMSGWLLMGLPGALFATGMSELWIVIGLLIGTWANWKWIAPRLRSYSEVANNSITLPSFFENRLHDSSRLLRIIAAGIIIFFFTFYVSSGMVAGGRYFESTFHGDYLTGMLIVGSITVIYTFVGGFLAVSYTDVVQGLLMFAALIIVPVMAFFALDNVSELFTFATNNAYGPHPEGNPTYFNLVSGVSLAAIIGNLAWGLGYMGQPHIVTRFMALRNPSEAKQGRVTGVFWVTLCYIGAIATAIISTVYFAQKGETITDTTSYETIFLDLARLLFHPLIAGVILTAVLAAIMSTMSSQLLITASALVEDLYRVFAKKQAPGRVLLLWSRVMVVVVALVAIILAVNPSDSILSLVGFAWAGFGSAFGPVMIAALYWKRLTAPGAIAGMTTGAVVSFVWGNLEATSSMIYEIVPGFIAATAAMIIVSLLTRAPEEAPAEFDEALAITEYSNAHPDLSFSQAREAIHGTQEGSTAV
ncbi:sodium/proline symporter PutP [Corynebacterium breve]|uniref:Sodium/proline symporter n=1 Tax=Corynebacterium breve TaxID=3049799 RepID=A0ABY8VM17_9CORY|nr:sodium/proline symporter PutP [Corynebacterium breve]WIM68600.1 sodium/proline symporter PutP [Corynebacterium breve]